MRKGFTLVEAVISLFVFMLIMLSLSSTFVKSFTGYKNTRAVQKDAENAQFALNLMAKELRTSTIVSSGGSQPQQSVMFYDYSQKTCIEYRIASVSKQLEKRSKPVTLADPLNPSSDDCNAVFTATSFLPIVKTEIGSVTGNFQFTLSEKIAGGSGAVGKITVSLQITEGTQKANVQTTSSLRDYGYIGLMGP